MWSLLRGGVYLLQGEEVLMLGGSKKDSKLRRAEVLGSGEGSLGQVLCQLCSSSAGDMLRDPLACDTIVEVALAGADGEPMFLMSACYVYL